MPRGGAIIAVADGFFDFTGPANEMMAEQLSLWRRRVVEDIHAIDPAWRESRLVPTTVKGMQNELSYLRFERAAAYFRTKGDPRPLQVETLRFVQDRADHAYAVGLSRLKAGQLMVRLSNEEALGNFIDRTVRLELRDRYSSASVDAAGRGPVRVNRREDDSSGTDVTYRRPDARVGNIAYDVTLTRKTLETAQVRGFFNADFRPDRVIIIRPRQLGQQSTYVITRPEKR